VIRVERGRVLEPASLKRPYGGRGRFKGKTEAERVAIEYAEHVAAGNPPTTFTFTYERYSEADVKFALNQLFGGKCAYCETRYAATQPVDVEHWRPKSEVHERDANGARVVLPGYHWLASDWENLLPSCIDCNRERGQKDVVTGVEETLGKANQFPVNGPRLAPPAPGQPVVVEDVLLLNPCHDDPAEHLDFRDDGAVLPRQGSPKGQASIRVYALNRTELALDRLGVARLIEQRLRTIEGLSRVVGDPALPETLRRDLQDLAAHEIDALHEMAEPDREYAALARQLIEENAPPSVRH
jgi:uncharacterized protein (TIGR02646 family)